MKGDVQEVVCRYDISSDILGIKVNYDFSYEQTVEMGENLFLDFDVNNVPVSLEILDASKRFNLPKECLKNIICFNIDICVDEKSISIDAKIGVLMDNVRNDQFFKSFISNRGNFPTNLVHLVLA